jgi:hypothetical protein
MGAAALGAAALVEERHLTPAERKEDEVMRRAALVNNILLNILLCVLCMT